MQAKNGLCETALEAQPKKAVHGIVGRDTELGLRESAEIDTCLLIFCCHSPWMQYPIGWLRKLAVFHAMLTAFCHYYYWLAHQQKKTKKTKNKKTLIMITTLFINQLYGRSRNF